MFGFGKVQGLNRKEWNTRVKNLLENRLEIVADSTANPMFPGIIIFGSLLDEGWNQKVAPEDNAIYIALRYWSGAAAASDSGLREAKRIDEALTDFIYQTVMEGKISEARGQQFVAFYDENRWKPDVAPEAPSYMDRAMDGFKISNDLMFNGSELTDLFVQARDLLKAKYANYGCDVELDKANYEFQMFLVNRSIGPTFNKKMYDEQAMVLVQSIVDLSNAYDAKGLDIRPAFKPVTDGLMKDMQLVNTLEHRST